MNEPLPPQVDHKAAYYRRDQQDGVTAPDLTRTGSYAEHIVRARGKRTQFTSVSLSPIKIRRFGPTLYRVRREALQADSHELVEHHQVMSELRRVARQADKSDRARALQAIRYADSAEEGLIDWRFDTPRVDRQELLTWAWGEIQRCFSKPK